MPFFPQQGGNDSRPLKFVMGTISFLVFLTCIFLQAQGLGVFEFLGDVGNTILSVLDELWKNPE